MLVVKTNKQGLLDRHRWELIETACICRSQTVSRLPHEAAANSRGFYGMIEFSRETRDICPTPLALLAWGSSQLYIRSCYILFDGVISLKSWISCSLSLK